MATIHSPPTSTEPAAAIEYPTGDGQPVGETPIHRDNLLTAVKLLQRHFAHDPMVYASGNMFVYYEKGNRRKHVSPDVFVAVGVPKEKPRDAYFVWEEAHGPDVVIELTSKSTEGEDVDDKKSIYQDEMPVPEYFLFDPKDEYLEPSLQGYRLRQGKYVPIEMVDGRLPSEVLGLHLERDGEWLRFYDPASGLWLPTPEEREAALEARLDLAEAERQRAEGERQRMAEKLQGSTEEIGRLRRELDEWHRRFGGPTDV